MKMTLKLTLKMISPKPHPLDLTLMRRENQLILTNSKSISYHRNDNCYIISYVFSKVDTCAMHRGVLVYVWPYIVYTIKYTSMKFDGLAPLTYTTECNR